MRYLYIHFIVLLLSSCVSSEPDMPVFPVIEGWIDSDGYPIVQFTSSIAPGYNENNLNDKLIQWGKVTISDGEKTVIMTGGPLSTIFPPFRYYTYEMEGTPGKKYKITAEFDELYAESECIMPAPTPIERIDLEPIVGSDSLRSATLYFISPDDCPAYYGVTIKKAAQGERPYPAMLGTIAVFTPGEEVAVAIMNPKNKLDGMNVDFVPQLKVGQNIVVSLCRLTPEVYEFWREYDNVTIFGGSQFVSTGSIKGNIQSGYGIWSARGTDSVDLIVK